MIITRRDKVTAFIIIFFLFLAFMSLAWLTSAGRLQILADTLRNGLK